MKNLLRNISPIVKPLIFQRVRKINLTKLFKFYSCGLVVFLVLPITALAEMDPFTSAGNGISKILFGTLGTSLCGIIIGATFLMAKVGKISWDKFISVGLCTAGFLGAPSLVYMIKSWVSY